MSNERPDDPNELLTRQETAKVLSVSVSTIQNLCNSKRLGSYRIGRSVRIPRRAIQDFLEGRRPAMLPAPFEREDLSTDPPTESLLAGLEDAHHE